MDDSKNSNLETTHNHQGHLTVPSTSSQDFKGTHEEFFLKSLEGSSGGHEAIGKASFWAAGEGGHKAERNPSPPPPAAQPVMMEEESVREKLKRHRVEVSGRVCIPDIWAQEDLLKNWIDCTVFDSSVDKSSLMSAREALVQEGRSTLGIENSC